MRFDFHRPTLSAHIVTKAAPLPILRLRHQPALYGIPVDITQLLHEHALAPHIEIVVAGLPEGIFSTQPLSARDRLLQRLHSERQSGALWLVNEHVHHVFRHYHVAIDQHAVLFGVSVPVTLQRSFECARSRSLVAYGNN